MSKKKRHQQILSSAYYNPARQGSYGGVKRLQNATKKKKSIVKDWLSHQDAYTLHRPL